MPKVRLLSYGCEQEHKCSLEASEAWNTEAKVDTEVPLKDCETTQDPAAAVRQWACLDSSDILKSMQ